MAASANEAAMHSPSDFAEHVNAQAFESYLSERLEFLREQLVFDFKRACTASHTTLEGFAQRGSPLQLRVADQPNGRDPEKKSRVHFDEPRTPSVCHDESAAGSEQLAPAIPLSQNTKTWIDSHTVREQKLTTRPSVMSGMTMFDVTVQLVDEDELTTFRERERRLFPDHGSKRVRRSASLYDDEEASILVNLMRTPRGRWAAFAVDLLDGATKFHDEVYLDISTVWMAKASRGGSRHSDFQERHWSVCATPTNEQFEPPERTWPVIYPTNPFRLVWIAIGALLVTYDILLIPMRIAGFFPDAQDRMVDLISQPTIIFWLADIILNFFVAFHTKGYVETRLPRISSAYLRSWFALDVGVMFTDIGNLFVLWYATDMESGDHLGTTNAMRIARMLRILRLARLLRLGKLGTVLGELLNDTRSETLLLMSKLLEHLAMILLMNHYIACIWYALAFHQMGSGETWLEAKQVETDLWYEGYTLALHWSLTQFTPSTQDIAPKNGLERFFAIVVVIFALVSFSSFVSGVTNTVNQLRQMNKLMRSESYRIRTFLSSRKVSTRLGSRILHFFRQNFRRTRRVHEADIKFFQQFPESLLIDLHRDIHSKILESHRMFRALDEIDKAIATRICHTAIGEASYLPRQDVFLLGAECNRAYVVSQGVASYTEHVLGVASSVSVTLESFSWLAEMALYVHWTHCGQLSAKTGCSFALLEVPRFQSVIAKHGGPCYVTLKRYVAFLVGQVEKSTDHLTDLPLDDAILEKVVRRVMSFDTAAKVMMKKGLSTSDPSLRR